MMKTSCSLLGMNVYLDTKNTLDKFSIVYKKYKITKYTKKYKSVENNKINFYESITIN